MKNMKVCYNEHIEQYVSSNLLKECTVYSNTWQSRSNSEKPVTVVLWQCSSPKWKIDHTNGVYVPYSFQKAVLDFFLHSNN